MKCLFCQASPGGGNYQSVKLVEDVMKWEKLYDFDKEKQGPVLETK